MALDRVHQAPGAGQEAAALHLPRGALQRPMLSGTKADAN